MTSNDCSKQTEAEHVKLWRAPRTLRASHDGRAHVCLGRALCQLRAHPLQGRGASAAVIRPQQSRAGSDDGADALPEGGGLHLPVRLAGARR